MRYSVRLGFEEKLLLLDLARELTARGISQWKCVREMLWLLVKRRVEVWDGTTHLSARRLALCYRWAECHRDMIVSGRVLPDPQRKALHNLARTFVHGVSAHRNVQRAIREDISGGRRVECRGEYDDAVSVGHAMTEAATRAVRARG